MPSTWQGTTRDAQGLVGIGGFRCPASSSSSTCLVLEKTAHPTRCSPGAPLASVSLCELGVQMRHACSSLVPRHTFKGASLWPLGSPKLPGPILGLSIPAILGAALFSNRYECTRVPIIVWNSQTLTDMPTRRQETGDPHSSSCAPLTGHDLRPLWTNASILLQWDWKR